MSKFTVVHPFDLADIIKKNKDPKMGLSLVGDTAEYCTFGGQHYKISFDVPCTRTGTKTWLKENKIKLTKSPPYVEGARSKAI